MDTENSIPKTTRQFFENVKFRKRWSIPRPETKVKNKKPYSRKEKFRDEEGEDYSSEL